MPRWPSSVTAPAIVSAIPRTGSEPPGRSEPPRASTTATPTTSSPAPSTAAPDSPSASRNAIAEAAISARPIQRVRLLPYIQSAR